MSKYIDTKWRRFIKDMPHHQIPFSKRNWGNPNHSLCSYQGKLKPAIAYHLVKVFVPKAGVVFDPFAGAGTIPFEGALNGITAYGMDLSPLAYYIASPKLHKNNVESCVDYIEKLSNFIASVEIPSEYIKANKDFGFNKTIKEYYHQDTFMEVLKARLFFQQNPPKTSEEKLVLASLLHILHGNRPYALSRKSHPIVPYAPSGDYIYKNLVEKLKIKTIKAATVQLPDCFVEGDIMLGDSTKVWPDNIHDIDAIITSPPFYDSTRFYLINWIRLWFLGWNYEDFETESLSFVDEKQKTDFTVYDTIFEQAKERLKTNGYFVLHLGKSDKCNMGEVLRQKGKHWFKKAKLYDENVTDCESFGIRDIGRVTSHQYLILE
ncbi:MAG: hypothetical protein K6A41_10830 [Bacteroidales bacterium]|nr:hypothetical protein [Bacteroidales bacterium]